MEKILRVLALTVAIFALVQSASIREERRYARSGSDSWYSSSSESSSSNSNSNEVVQGQASQGQGQANNPVGQGTNQSPNPSDGRPALPTVEPTTECIPVQECRIVDLLEDGGEPSRSATYSAAFSTFNPTTFSRSVDILIDELNNPETIQCARAFTDIRPTEVQATQTDGDGIIDFIFAGPETEGQDRTLNNAEVRFTLPNLGTFGDLQLRLFYDEVGALDNARTERFFRPPGNTEFFQFPLQQMVCEQVDPIVCATEPQTPPPQVSLPDPLPNLDLREVGSLIPIASSNAQCTPPGNS